MTINLPNVSKTTLNGYLTVSLAACVALLQVPGIPQKYTVVIGGVVAFLRIMVGHSQKDATPDADNPPPAGSPTAPPPFPTSTQK